MRNLEQEFQYEERKIIVPDAELLDSIVPPEGEYAYTEIPAGLEIDGEPVHYQIVVDNLSQKIGRLDSKYVFVTACIKRGDDTIGVAIKDNAVNEGNVSWGRSQILTRGGRFPPELLAQIPGKHSHRRGIPWDDLRLNDGDDTFFVREEYRGKGIGRAIFFTSLELSRRLGATQHNIMTGEDHSPTMEKQTSFYAQFVPLTDGWAWIFPLTQEG
ncbi:MAG: GNAT family N-acetyltransferase [Candidatus Dojkabacteria bacterium]|nr:MAG: GNAT family N-acetyltransferase [Candidatus Dojkabacteria bacterium]